MYADEIMNLLEGDDDQPTLEQARRSLEWPEWEQAIVHAAYVHNRAYSSAVKPATPYEHWHNKWLDISHLREFGTPVWVVLLQGQMVQLKMGAESKWCTLLRH